MVPQGLSEKEGAAPKDQHADRWGAGPGASLLSLDGVWRAGRLQLEVGGDGELGLPLLENPFHWQEGRRWDEPGLLMQPIKGIALFWLYSLFFLMCK